MYKLPLAIFAVIIGAIGMYTYWPDNSNILTQSRTVYLSGSTFDLDVTVLVTEDTAYAAQYVRDNLDSTVTNKDFEARAVTFGPEEGKPIIVWLSDAEDKGVVAHELFHAMLYKMYWASMELNSETEEAFAYELQYLTSQFYNQINKIQ